jgi:glyoxylase-like metal-dependent hydrolase (beta-lactamase superfamily II)
MSPRVIDSHYFDQPGVAAVYLLREGKRAAFVDNNTAHAMPRLLAALAEEDLSPEDVEYLVVTHVHLDHAGGTSALAAACPRATVLCHPRAARHLVDPSKLVRSARLVYGAETFERLYGHIGPIPESRVRVVEDGEVIDLGPEAGAGSPTRPLRFLHTRGHANHHMCMLDERERDIYTGDSFGLRYPSLQRAGLFIFPSTSPTDFDPVEARRSIERIVASGAQRAYPTHYGAVTDLAEASSQLLRLVDGAESILEHAMGTALEGRALEEACRVEVDELFDEAVARRGLLLSDGDRRFLEIDLSLNAQGIALVASARRAALLQPPAR